MAKQTQDRQWQQQLSCKLCPGSYCLVNVRKLHFLICKWSEETWEDSALFQEHPPPIPRLLILQREQ